MVLTTSVVELYCYLKPLGAITGNEEETKWIFPPTVVIKEPVASERFYTEHPHSHFPPLLFNMQTWHRAKLKHPLSILFSKQQGSVWSLRAHFTVVATISVCATVSDSPIPAEIQIQDGVKQKQKQKKKVQKTTPKKTKIKDSSKISPQAQALVQRLTPQ